MQRSKRGSFQQRGRGKIALEPRAHQVQPKLNETGKKTKSSNDSLLILSCTSDETLNDKNVTEIDDNTDTKGKSYTSFFADSGATEHLTNTKEIFSSFDKDTKIVIK